MRTEAATAELRRIEDRVRAIPGVVGAGVGLSESGAVIQVFVDRAADPQAVRDHLRGLTEAGVEIIVQDRAADAF